MSILEKTWTYVRNWWCRTESKHDVVIDLFPKDNVLIGIGGSTKLSANVTTSSPELFIKWQKVTGNTSTNIRTDSIKYSGSSCSMLTPELVINDVDKTDEGAYRLSVTTVTETVTGPKVLLNVFGDPVIALPKDERNFLRYYLLCQTIATESARLYFTRKVPEPTLAAHLISYKTNLKFSYWKCTSDQLTALFPAAPGVAKSGNFDFTLLYKLIRNTLSPLSTPTRGWGSKPLHGNFKEEDDIERIRHNRNLLAHNTEFKLNDYDFNDMWTDLSQAIVRLSFGSLSVDVVNLSKQKLDTQLKNEIFENLKIVIEIMKGEINILHQDIEECRERIQTIEDTHIPQNIRQTYLEMLKKWTHEDVIYYDKTRVYQATEDMVQSCSIVGLVGGPGCGKTALAKHIALAYEQDGWEVIPVADFDKIVMYGNSKLKQIFVIDDILGVFSVNMNWYYNLNSHKEGILEVLGNDSKLLYTCRRSVYYEAVKLQSFVLEKIIDLESTKNILNDKEKKNILAKHCRFIGVPEDMYCNLSLPSSSLMFPLLCKIFSTGYKTHVSVDKFFAKPFHYLIKELDTMEYRTPKQYAALVLCVLSNNMLSIEKKTVDEKEMKQEAYNTCGVNLGTSDKEIKNIVSNMVGTYLIENGNYFTFIHDAIYEIVAYHYGKNNPLIILRYMNSTFIATKITVDQHQSNNESTNLLTLIDTKHYVQLAEQLWKHLQSLELFDVFMNKSLHHLPFLNIFIHTLVEKPYNTLRDLICHEQDTSKVLKIYKDSKIQCKEEQKQRLLMTKCTEISALHNPRTISWIIYYGHTKLLTSIVNLVKKNKDSTDIVFGSDITEQTRLLTLGCYSGDPDMVNLILKYVKIGCINKTSLDKTLACIDNVEFISVNQHRTYTPLTSACDSGNLSVVKILLKNNAKINKCDDYNRFPLLCASEKGHIEVVKYLVQKGCNINRCNEYKETSLYRATYDGHHTVVKYLVQKGADVNQCTTYKKSPLYIACHKGHTDIVQFMVEKGSHVNQCSTVNKSPLYQACKAGHTAIVEFLVDKGADITKCCTLNKSPLYQACERGHTAVVEFLVEKGADINQCDLYNISPLNTECERGHKAIVEFLVEKGADVNQCDKYNKTPLYKACKGGHTAVVEFLVEKGADVNQCDLDNISPLNTVCETGHKAIVEFLVEKGADVNQCDTYSKTPLYKACKRGHGAVVEFLVEKGADVTQSTKYNKTPLYKACERGHKAIVEFQVEKGADINQCSTFDKSPLYKACKGGHKAVVKYLVDKGADVNKCTKRNESPLYGASRKRRLDVVKYLVDKGAGVNMCTKSNESPLFGASRKGHFDVVKFLVDKGADVNMCTESNKSPLFEASRKRHFDVVKFLVDKGADVNICTESNESPLFEASRKGDFDIVKFLVQKGAVVDKCNTNAESSLHTASAGGHFNVIEYLVQQGANVNQQNADEETPLYKAARSFNSRLEVVKYLVNTGANVNQCSESNKSPLYWASYRGHIKVVELLLQNGADVNKCSTDNMSPLYQASQSGYYNVVKYLVENGADVNQCDKDNKSPLYKSCKEGHTAVVEFLLEYRANVNQLTKNSESPLCEASTCGHVDLVEMLVQKGAVVNHCNTNDESSLYKASRKGHDKVVEYLVQNGADVNQFNKDKESPLSAAVRTLKSPLKVVKYLINKGANVNQCSESNKSTLYWASHRGHIKVVKLLLQNGAEVNKCSIYSESPLYKACEGGHYNVVEYLVQNGAHVNQCNADKKTPLYNAVEKEHVEMVKLLMGNKADLTVRTQDGISPLQLAVWLNFPDISTELMKMENKIIPFSGNHHLLDILSDLRKTVLFIDGVVLDGSGTEVKQSLSQLLLNVINVKPIRFLEHLIKLGLNVNQCNNEGQSLLEVLIETPRVLKKYRKLELFIQNGADLTVRDCQSLSMLGKIRKFLKKHQNRYSDIIDRKKSMQTLRKHLRRNSV